MNLSASIARNPREYHNARRKFWNCTRDCEGIFSRCFGIYEHLVRGNRCRGLLINLLLGGKRELIEATLGTLLQLLGARVRSTAKPAETSVDSRNFVDDSVHAILYDCGAYVAQLRKIVNPMTRNPTGRCRRRP